MIPTFSQRAASAVRTTGVGAHSLRVARAIHRRGVFLFLEAFLDLEAKPLRVLQEGEFERVDGTETRKVDLRILAATDRDLARHARDGSFRADLYIERGPRRLS